MSYKTILVHLDSSPRASTRLEFALQLAFTHEAHLIGLFAPFQPNPNLTSLYGVAAAPDFINQLEALRTAQSTLLERQFRSGIARQGLAGEWRSTEEYANHIVPLHARHADLVIAGQFERNAQASFVAENFCENLVLSSGCPTLFLPYAGTFPVVGKHVMVAWDGSREATRAVHDALPFLQGAARVTVVTANALPPKEPRQRIPGADIAAVIARHGVKVEIVEVEGADGRHIGDFLLSQAADLGADLLVMGAYGHPRWQEIIVGGVTRTLFESMTIPVLMAH
jgi:nucleotide-binding universal stress UspA family protein